MYELPTKADFDRNLSTRVHAARKEAKAASIQIASECADRGMTYSTSRIALTAQRIDEIHGKEIERAMILVRGFAERMHTSVSQVTPWARPFLETLATELLAEIPAVRFPNEQRRTRIQYAYVFQQRLDGALRDIEIGFIGGHAIMLESQKIQTKALSLLKIIYDRTRGNSEPVFVEDLGSSIGFTEPESQAAWRYLKDKGLIQTFGIQYTARINAAGIDAIESARRHPDQPTGEFPYATYNIVNNTMNIRTATNSPVQQGGVHSSQHQAIAYDSQKTEDISVLVEIFKSNLDELHLDSRTLQKVNAQLATLSAQLTDEPDHIIVQQAGKTLRNITEGAVGSLIAAAAQPGVWVLAADIMGRLFH